MNSIHSLWNAGLTRGSRVINHNEQRAEHTTLGSLAVHETGSIQQAHLPSRHSSNGAACSDTAAHRHQPVSTSEIRTVAALVCVFTAAYALYGLFRHWHFGSSAFDLGIFDQAIWNLSRFQAPASSINGFSNVMGDHFYPIIVAFAPLYWLAPAPETLITAILRSRRRSRCEGQRPEPRRGMKGQRGLSWPGDSYAAKVYGLFAGRGPRPGRWRHVGVTLASGWRQG